MGVKSRGLGLSCVSVDREGLTAASRHDGETRAKGLLVGVCLGPRESGEWG